MDTKTAQCLLMDKLFKDEASLKSGITMHYYFNIKGSIEINAKKVKQVKNLQTQVNKKFTDTTNLKKLISIDGNRIKVNKLYLLKD